MRQSNMRRHHCDAIHHKKNQSGFSLVYIIIVITVISALSAGVMALTTSSNYSEVSDRYAIQARYAAISGLNHIAGMHEAYRNMKDKKFDITDDDGNVIATYEYKAVLQNVANSLVRVRIVGTAAPGTSHQARYNLVTQFRGANRGRIAFQGPGGIQDGNWSMTSSDPNKKPVIVDYEHERFDVGHNQKNAFGSFVYTGDQSFNFGANNCTDGECDFRWGIRAFMTTWYGANAADGLVMVTFNGEDNDWDSVGGHSTHGEMIGYAGDGRYKKNNSWHWLDPEGDGIQPPKIGIELDNYGNEGAGVCGSSKSTAYPFNGARNGPNTMSRYDIGGSAGNGVDHMAVMLWGLDQEYKCAYNEWGATKPEGAKTMDDNTHGFTSHLQDENLGFTEDHATGSYVTLDGTTTRVGQAFTLKDLNGARSTKLDTEQRVIAASFYIRASTTNSAWPTGDLRARLYTTNGTPGSGAVPDSLFLSSSVMPTNQVFTDWQVHDDYRYNHEWRLVTFFFTYSGKYSNDSHTSSPNDRNADIAEASPDNIIVGPGNYVVVLEYNDGTSSRSIDVAVEDKTMVEGTQWPGNLVTWNGSGWSTDSSRIPIYYVHLYDQLFPFIRNLDYTDQDHDWRDYRLDGNDQNQFARNAIRYEIDRDTEPTWFGSERRYKYNIRIWVRHCTTDQYIGDECTDYVNTVFSDTSGDLSVDKNPPAIDETIYLTKEMHEKFETAIFGFTEATGGSTQSATFSHFVLQFKRPFDTIIDDEATPGNMGNFENDF